ALAVANGRRRLGVMKPEPTGHVGTLQHLGDPGIEPPLLLLGSPLPNVLVAVSQQCEPQGISFRGDRIVRVIDAYRSLRRTGAAVFSPACPSDVRPFVTGAEPAEAPATTKGGQMRHAPATNPRLGWVLALTSTAYFMVVLDSVVVITALPRMQ